MNDDEQSYMLRSISSGFLRSIVNAISAGVAIPLVIRQIGIERYGKYALIMVFVEIASLADLGISKAVVYYLSEEREREDNNRLYTTSLVLNLGVVVLTGASVFGLYLTGFDIWGGMVNRQLGALILLCGGAILVSALLVSFHRAVMEAKLEIDFVNYGFILQNFLVYGALLYLSFQSLSVRYLIISTTVSFVFIALIHIAYCYTKYDYEIVSISFFDINKVGRTAFEFVSMSLMSIIIKPMNRFLLVYISGDSAVYGLFDVGVKFAKVSSSLLTAVGQPLFSLFSSFSENIARIKRMANKYARYGFILYVFGCGTFYFIGPVLSGWFVDENHSPDLFIASFIMIAGSALHAVMEPYLRALWALGEIPLTIKIKVLQPTVNIALIFIFFPLSALYRFSFAYAIAYAVTGLAVLLAFQWKYQSIESDRISFHE